MPPPTATASVKLPEPEDWDQGAGEESPTTATATALPDHLAMTKGIVAKYLGEDQAAFLVAVAQKLTTATIRDIPKLHRAHDICWDTERGLPMTRTQKAALQRVHGAITSTINRLSNGTPAPETQPHEHLNHFDRIRLGPQRRAAELAKLEDWQQHPDSFALPLPQAGSGSVLTPTLQRPLCEATIQKRLNTANRLFIRGPIQRMAYTRRQ
jgi:hypothetical protein